MINSVSSTPSSLTVDRKAVAKAIQTSFRSSMASAASQVSGSQDTLQITGMSDSQKLAELKRLHEQTDYSGMSDVEKYKLIRDRFDSCFPVMAMRGGLFGATYVGDDPTRHKTIRELVIEEEGRQMIEAGVQTGSKNGIYLESSLLREAYYSGMSDQEIFTAASQRYGNTMTGRACALFEIAIMNLGTNTSRAAEQAIDAMHQSLIKQKGLYVDPITGLVSPFQEAALRQAADNTKVSWGQVAGMVRDFFPDDGDTVDWLLEQMADRKQ